LASTTASKEIVDIIIAMYGNAGRATTSVIIIPHRTDATNIHLKDSK
jgi:hypothetical protein